MEIIPEGMAIPPELQFKPSGMEADQIGVWSKKTVTRDETYGPFLGVRKKLSEVHDDTYSWEIRGPKGRRLFCIDASDPSQGNWMRYVKSARYYEEQNMIAVQENKNIYYKTLRDIPPGEELLCWYNSGEPPSEEMHDALQKEAQSKREKDINETAEKLQMTSSMKSSSKTGTKLGMKSHDALSDKSPAKGKNNKGQPAAKPPKQNNALTGSKNATKAKQISTKETEDAKSIKNCTIRDQAKKVLSKHAKVLNNNDQSGSEQILKAAADGQENVSAVKEMMSVPTTITNDKQMDRAPAVEITPLDADVDKVQDQLEVDTKHNEQDELIAADGSLKSPDMPVLENMTKEGFLIPSPTKQVHTSWSSVNGSMVRTREIIVGDIACHEIAPPTISPILPFTKNQAETVVKKTVPPIMNDKTDVISAIITPVSAAATNTDSFLENNLAIQAPDVSSTEESSGTEREMENDGNKESHVTSSRSNAQVTDSDKKEGDHFKAAEIADNCENVSIRTGPSPIEASKKNENDNGQIETVKGSNLEELAKIQDKERHIKSGIQIVGKKQRVVRKNGKKQKSLYKCRVCGSVFSKPVHVKIHIAKKHGVQARKSGSKFKVFVPGKREKIRTRSVTKSVKKVSDWPHMKEEVTKKREVDSEVGKTAGVKKKKMMKAKTSSDLQDKTSSDLQDKTSSDLQDKNTILQKDGFTHEMLSGPASMVPMMYNSHAYGHREGKSCGTYRCEFCHRVFRYKTWLTRHIEKKHPGETPKISFVEQFAELKKEQTDYLVSEDKYPAELSKEEIELLKTTGNGKRLKIFPCSLCGRRFSSKTNVRRHKRIIHKILVRPRRTRLPYPEFTVEQEVKEEVPYVKKNLQFSDAPPKPAIISNTPSEMPSPPVLTGMRKPRKNKSPSKRSRGIHSQEDFADSYLTFPIEQNPNPLSAFIQTKSEAYDSGRASTSQPVSSNQKETPLVSRPYVTQVQQASLPTNENETISSRRTGPPPAATYDCNNASTSEKGKNRVEQSVSTKYKPYCVTNSSPVDSSKQLIIQEQSNSPSILVHQHKSSHVVQNPRNRSSNKDVFSRQPNTQCTYNTHTVSSPSYGTIPISSISIKQAKLEFSSSNQAMAKSKKIVHHEPKKLISTNLWGYARKPQPFIPRKQQLEKTRLSDENKELTHTTIVQSNSQETYLISTRPTVQIKTHLMQSLNSNQKLDTLSVLNLKRKQPTPPPPPSPPPPPLLENGVLDLSLNKKPRFDPQTAPPSEYICPEQIDPNLPLDLSSGSKINKTHIKPRNVASTHQANPIPSYASTSRAPPAKLNYANTDTAFHHSGPKYEFHHMSPASFIGPEQISPRKKPGPKKKSVQSMLQQQETCLNQETPVLIRKMYQTSPMQIHTKQPKSNMFKPLLSKSSRPEGQKLVSVSPRQPNPQLSPSKGIKQLSPHLVAAQVIKQAHAQSALRPILPKPVPGASTPVIIGGKVVATLFPSQQNQSETRTQRGNMLDNKELDSRVGFSCNVCEICYASIKALAKHVVIHAEEWPYKCEFCIRLYQSADELIKHRTKLHHMGKTFSCGVCKRDFGYKSNLKKHQIDVHGLSQMDYRELGPKELRAQNFTNPNKLKIGPAEQPVKAERVSFIEQELKKQTAAKIGKMKLPLLKTVSAAISTIKSTPSPRKSVPINPQRHHPFAHARQIGYLNMLSDPRNQEVLQTVSAHRCTKCLKEFTETSEFHGHIMECALEGLDKVSSNGKERERHIDAERHVIEATEKKMKLKAYTKSKKKAIQLRQSGPGKRQRAKPGLKIYNPKKYTRRRSSTNVDDIHSCPGCDKKFYFINKLERHMRMCPNRDTFFKGTKVVVESTAESANKDILKKGHCCPFCARQFTYLKSLKKHSLVCLARNPNEEDPIRLIEENFKNAQKMAAELHSTETKPIKNIKNPHTTGEFSKNKNSNNFGKKRRRRKKRTDVISKQKKCKRVTAASDFQEATTSTSSPRKSGPKKGAKKNRLVIKMGQTDPPKKDAYNLSANKKVSNDTTTNKVETNYTTANKSEADLSKEFHPKVDQVQGEVANDKSETTDNVAKNGDELKIPFIEKSAYIGNIKLETIPNVDSPWKDPLGEPLNENKGIPGQNEEIKFKEDSKQDEHSLINETSHQFVDKSNKIDTKEDKQPALMDKQYIKEATKDGNRNITENKQDMNNENEHVLKDNAN